MSDELALIRRKIVSRGLAKRRIMLDYSAPLLTAYVLAKGGRIDMKKTFELSHPKIKPARMVDSVKHDIKKYLKRERRKPLPEGAGFWDFDCRFGLTEENAVTLHVAEFSQHIDKAVADGATTFYVEILAKAGDKKSD